MSVGQPAPSRIDNFKAKANAYKAILLATAVIAAPAAALAQAADVQLAQAGAQTRAFDIAAQGLPQALVRFTEVTGLQLFVDGNTTRALQSPGVRGTLTPEAALARLLDGTGLTYRFINPTTVTLVEAPKSGTGAVLPTLTVQGQRGAEESAWGPVEGYVATRSATGTKTDTPLLETPQSITVITREQMEEQKPRQVGEALRYVAGIRAESGGVQMQHDGIQMRGFNQFAGYLYRDGTREFSSSYLGFLSPEPYNMERIEVIKGPASVLYGQNSPGGLVNMVTKRPTDRPINEVELQGGSFERKQIATDVGGAVNDKVSYRIVGLARDSETQVDYVDDNRLFLAGGLTIRPSDNTSVTLMLEHQRDDSLYIYGLPAIGTLQPSPNGKIPRNRFVGEPGFDSTYAYKTSFSALTEHSLSDTWTLRQTLRFSDHDYDSQTIFLGAQVGTSAIYNRNVQRRLAATRAFTADQHAEAKFETGPVKHTALFGFDYQHNSMDVMTGNATNTGGLFNLFSPTYGTAVATPAWTAGSDQRIVQMGAYVQDQIKYDNWVLMLGGRQDRAVNDNYNRFTRNKSHQDDQAFTGRAGLMYLFDIGLAPYISYAESFEPVGGTDFSGRQFLPENGQQREIGVKFQPKGYDSFITASAFDLKRENVTTADPVNTGFSIQTGEVTSRGLELEGKASLNRELDLIATYTYQDVEVTRSNGTDFGKRPARVPEHMASMWADYTLRSGQAAGLGFGAGVRYIGSSYGNSTNTFEMPAYALVDGAVHYDWQNFRFAVNAANLFDKENLTCSSATGCSYGIGRTIIASMRYRW